MRIFRRVSRTDEIDRALNALVSRRPYDPETALVSDVIDTHTQAMSALRSDPAAMGPAAGTWNRVLRASAQPTAKGQEKMSATATLQSPLPGAISAPAKRQTGGFSHFVNIAASVLVVAAIAFSGWFATMHLQPSGDNSNGLAFAPSTPTAGTTTCDVTPLTVDEVMQIVKNPYAFMADNVDPDITLDPTFTEYVAGNDLMNGNPLPTEWYVHSTDHQTPTDETFASASEAVNQYLACLSTATFGQYWAMIDPVAVQRAVLDRFPVFADEATVRAYVEATIDQGLASSDLVLEPLTSLVTDFQLVANPDIDQAASVPTADDIYVSLVAMGVVVTDTDGGVVLVTDSEGRSQELSSRAGSERPVLLVGKSAITGQWYVLPWL